MADGKHLEKLVQQYELLRQQLIAAVGNGMPKQKLDSLKRELETIASQIRKIDVNRRL